MNEAEGTARDYLISWFAPGSLSIFFKYFPPILPGASVFFSTRQEAGGKTV
jgi:hypothetical protein